MEEEEERKTKGYSTKEGIDRTLIPRVSGRRIFHDNSTEKKKKRKARVIFARGGNNFAGTTKPYRPSRFDYFVGFGFSVVPRPPPPPPPLCLRLCSHSGVVRTRSSAYFLVGSSKTKRGAGTNNFQIETVFTRYVPKLFALEIRTDRIKLKITARQ